MVVRAYNAAVQTPAVSPRPGPLARTAAELVRIERLAAFRRAGRRSARTRLHSADALLGLVEECRVRGMRLVPSSVWMHVVRFLGAVEPKLRDDLGINRHVDHVGEVLFAAQAELMARAVAQRAPFEAEIVHLFRDEGGEDAAAGGSAEG